MAVIQIRNANKAALARWASLPTSHLTLIIENGCNIDLKSFLNKVRVHTENMYRPLRELIVRMIFIMPAERRQANSGGQKCIASIGENICLRSCADSRLL